MKWANTCIHIKNTNQNESKRMFHKPAVYLPPIKTQSSVERRRRKIREEKRVKERGGSEIRGDSVSTQQQVQYACTGHGKQ